VLALDRSAIETSYIIYLYIYILFLQMTMVGYDYHLTTIKTMTAEEKEIARVICVIILHYSTLQCHERTRKKIH